MEETKYLLSFKGNKKEIHKQFKEVCEQEGETMQSTIISLIKGHIAKNK